MASSSGWLAVLFLAGAPTTGFGLAQESLYIVRGAGIWRLYALDPSTGAEVRSVPLSRPYYRGMTFDGVRLVAIDQGPPAIPADHVASLHPADGTEAVLGPTGFNWNWPALEHDPTTGVLYATYADEVYRVDATSGALTLLGYLDGLKPFDFIGSLAIDWQGRAFGMGGPSGPGAALYSIDLTTLDAVHLGDLALGSGYVMDAAFDQSDQLWVIWNPSLAFGEGLYKVDIGNVSASLAIDPGFTPFGLAFGPAPAVTAHCTAKTTSLGCTPWIEGTGYPSPTAASGFVVTGQGVRNNTAGMLLYGAAGRASLPFRGGTLCLNPPLNRTRVVKSGGAPPPAKDCSGVFALDFNAFMSGRAGFAAGSVLNGQWYGRDGGWPAPNAISLTDGLEFTLLP